jgi:hypothetical protein
MTGSVAQVLSATSVEVYFDGVAFRHEMSLEEITPLPDFYCARLVRPQQLFLGSIGDEAIYADCADCEAEAAVIHGCIKDRQVQTALIPLNGGRLSPKGTFYVVVFVKLLVDRRTSRTDPTGSLADGHYEFGESDTLSCASQTPTLSWRLLEAWGIQLLTTFYPCWLQ